MDGNGLSLKAQDRRYGLPKPPISLPDKDDIHVVETAISSGANYIITFNLKDYPYPRNSQSMEFRRFTPMILSVI